MPLQRVARLNFERFAAAAVRRRKTATRASTAGLIRFTDRPSDSPYIERVWRSQSDHSGLFHSMAAVNWGVVVTRLEGKVSLTVRGPETRATMAECPAEGEWMGIHFKAGTFISRLRPGEMRDRKDATMPQVDGRRFWLEGAAWEYPDFERAEDFVDQLVRTGVIKTDPFVTALLHEDSPKLTKRTAERRVLQSTGLTRGLIHQIQRARRATCLLRRGVPIVEVVHQAGYYDQAHLTRSLKRFAGLTPGALAAGHMQLSLLYNTEDS